MCEGEAREGLCETGTCASSCHNDGGVIRNSEGALLLAPGQSQKKGDGDSVHLLRDSYGECSAAGGEADGAATGGSCIV